MQQENRRGVRLAVPQIHHIQNGAVDRLDEAGYGALAALASCAMSGTSWPASLRSLQVANYYSTTLQMLSLIAVRMRYPTCLHD